MTEFITRGCHAERRYEITIKTDNEEHYYAAQAYARLLIGHQKPQTNADRIRAMSDEEMLDLFRYRGCPPDRLTGKCVKVGVCEACWADWLKQPAEEE